MAESECLLLLIHTPRSAHGSAFSMNFFYVGHRRCPKSKIINYSNTSIIELSGEQINIEQNINEIFSALLIENYSVYGVLTSNESFCNPYNIDEVKDQIFNGEQDVKFWFHLLKKSKNNESDLLLLLDRSEFIVEWFDPEHEENNLCETWFTPFNFAETQNVGIHNDSVPARLGFWEKISNSITNKYSYNRAIKFSEIHSIPREDIFFYDLDSGDLPKEWKSKNGNLLYGFRTFVLISDFNEDPVPYIHKHVFREVKDGCFFCSISSDCCDTKWDKWDLYWDAEKDEPILTEDVVTSVSGYLAVDIPCGAGIGVKTGVKGVIYLAKKGSGAGSTWVVYQFLTKTGKYVGITVNFRKRMVAHGSRILGAPSTIFENIPDKITARGLEQIIIEHGRMANVLTEQIDSIRKTRPDRLSEGVEKAIQFITNNYPNKLSELQDAIEYLRTFY